MSHTNTYCEHNTNTCITKISVTLKCDGLMMLPCIISPFYAISLGYTLCLSPLEIWTLYLYMKQPVFQAYRQVATIALNGTVLLFDLRGLCPGNRWGDGII